MENGELNDELRKKMRFMQTETKYRAERVGIKQPEKQKNLLLLMCAFLHGAEVHLNLPGLSLPILLELSYRISRIHISVSLSLCSITCMYNFLECLFKFLDVRVWKDGETYVLDGWDKNFLLWIGMRCLPKYSKKTFSCML